MLYPNLPPARRVSGPPHLIHASSAYLNFSKSISRHSPPDRPCLPKGIVMQLPTLKQEKTEVGSYFVSNYPPYSTWTQDHVPAALTALDTPPTTDTKLGLY